MNRPTSPAMEQELDRVSARLGRTRDPLAEQAAYERGFAVVDRSLVMDDSDWARLAGEFREMGPAEKVILWCVVTSAGPDTFRNAFRPEEDAVRQKCKADYDAFMARAKQAHRHLSDMVLDVFRWKEPT